MKYAFRRFKCWLLHSWKWKDRYAMGGETWMRCDTCKLDWPVNRIN